ncbi:potassium channel subfamily K member 16-like [Anneissia japonica]|uniref:potassium channel subfamily K member 16-like n=1 Tax=Anneissia japonica TaxID=1529436 RepID=UPI001425A04D|nr:potassium channel subfamily K member 16-like [Anneissia japonica]
MARRTFKSNNRTMAKKLKLCLFVFFIFVLYLLFGSLVFSAIEKDNEINVTLRLSDDLNSFLDAHTCVNESELMEVLQMIKKAIDDGAYNVTFSNTTEDADLIWDTISGIFFCFTIVTTIGFGHITPKTTGGQIFCIVYASIGIPITGYLLSLLGDNFERFWKWYQRLFNKKFKCIRSVDLRRAMIIIFGTIPVLLVTLFLPSYYWQVEEKWTYWTSLYYTFITMTTIGFGDIVASIDNDTVSVWIRIFDLVLTIFTILLALGILTGILKIASRRIQKSKSIGTSRLSTMMKKLIGNESMINKDDKEVNIRTISKEVIESKTNGNLNHLNQNIYKEERTSTAKAEDDIDSSEQITHVEDVKRRTSEVSQATDLSCEDVSIHFSNRLELYMNRKLIISKDGLSDEMITNITDVVKNHILEATKTSGNNSSIKNPIAVNGTLNRAFVDDTQDTYVHVDMHADVTR